MHTNITMLMSLALDGEASPDEERTLHQHLAGCDTCAVAWRRWKTLDRQLAVAPMAAAPPTLLSGVLARLDERREQRQQQKLLLSGFVLAWGASMVSLLFVAGVVALWTYNNPAPASVLVSSGTQALSSLSILLRAIQGSLFTLGGNSLPVGIALFSCLTGCMFFLWLWMVARIAPLRGGVAEMQGAE